MPGFFARFELVPKAELHLHLEGSVAPATLVRLSARCSPAVFPTAGSVRRPLGSAETFLALYRDVCRLLRSPADYRLVARDLVRRLRREGTRHAEVYVSPAVVERIGLSWPEVVAAVEPVFATHERTGGGSITVLLDSVRHWGPEAASRVLDLHEAAPWRRVQGFGLGGDESAIPAREFVSIYRRVRRLGLAPLVHAGEWGGPDSVAEALEVLKPVRIAHGIAAALDPALVRRLARSGVALDVCPTSNVKTGALGAGVAHPALALLRAGVKITVSTDDPGLFGTTLRREYRSLARDGATEKELRLLARMSMEARLEPRRAVPTGRGRVRRPRGTATPSRPR